MSFFTRFPLRKDGRAGRDADGDGLLNEGHSGPAEGAHNDKDGKGEYKHWDNKSVEARERDRMERGKNRRASSFDNPHEKSFGTVEEFNDAKKDLQARLDAHMATGGDDEAYHNKFRDLGLEMGAVFAAGKKFKPKPAPDFQQTVYGLTRRLRR